MAITMAGLGSRFARAGHTRPKYEIEVLGRPLFDWSMLSLTAFYEAGWAFRFATRAGLGAEPYLRARCAGLGIEIGGIVELAEVTDGQATTAWLLAQDAPQDQPFAVYNIDTFVAPGAMVPPEPGACAGWMPCFGAPGEGWSFARLAPDGTVAEVREKQRISEHATVGLYWFDSAARYCALYERFFAKPGSAEKGERYIAPMYNQMIEEGARVEIATLALESVGMLGTPEQVAAFAATPPPGAQALILGAAQ